MSPQGNIAAEIVFIIYKDNGKTNPNDNPW